MLFLRVSQRSPCEICSSGGKEGLARRARRLEGEAGSEGFGKYSSSVCLSVLRVRSAHPEAVGRLRGLCKVREYPNGVSG